MECINEQRSHDRAARGTEMGFSGLAAWVICMGRHQPEFGLALQLDRFARH